ncbi:MAG: hypothetical protein PSV22_19820 [Pseudolabrys sp.]|nr:hypothetical protein [Pseudolabrys sp.]
MAKEITAVASAKDPTAGRQRSPKRRTKGLSPQRGAEYMTMAEARLLDEVSCRDPGAPISVGEVFDVAMRMVGLSTSQLVGRAGDGLPALKRRRLVLGAMRTSTSDTLQPSLVEVARRMGTPVVTAQRNWAEYQAAPAAVRIAWRAAVQAEALRWRDAPAGRVKVVATLPTIVALYITQDSARSKFRINS